MGEPGSNAGLDEFGVCALAKQDAAVTPAVTPERASPLRSLTMLLARGSFWTVGARVAAQMLLFGSFLLLARVQGAVVVGLFTVIWVIVRLGGLVASLGVDVLVLRAPDEIALRRYFARAFPVVSGVALVFAMALVGARPHVARWLGLGESGAALLTSAAVAIPISAILRTTTATLRRRLRFIVAVVAEDLIPASAIFLGVGWNLLRTFSTESLVTSIPLGLLSGLLCAVIATVSVGRSVDTSTTERRATTIAGGSLAVVAATGAGLLILWMDRLVLAALYEPEVVGLYQPAFQIAALLAFPLSALNTVLAPLFARLFQAGRDDEMLALFRMGIRWTVVLTLPAAILLLSAPGPIMGLLYGPEFEAGADALVVLTLAQCVNAGTGAIGLVLLVSDRERTWLVWSVLALGVAVAANLVLTPTLGGAGAAWAVLLANVAMFGGSSVTLAVQSRSAPYDRRTMWLSVAGLLSWGVSTTAVKVLETRAQWGVLATVGVLLTLVAVGIGIPRSERALVVGGLRGSES